MTEFEKQKEDISTKLMEIISEAGFMRDYDFLDNQDDLYKDGESLLKNFHALINEENYRKDKTLKSYVDNYCMDKSKLRIKPLEWRQTRDPDGCLESIDVVLQADSSIGIYRAYDDGRCYVVHSDDMHYWYRIFSAATNLEEAKLEVQKYHDRIVREQIV